MIPADKAKELVEDVSILSNEDMKMVEEKTLAAIADGRRITSMRVSAKGLDRRILWPLKNKLVQLGYDVKTVDALDATIIKWSW